MGLLLHCALQQEETILQFLVHHSGFDFLPLYHLSGASLSSLLHFPLQRLFFVLLQWVNLFACFAVTLPSLLLEMQHPVSNFAARSAHHVDNGSELPGIIFSVESDSLTCSKHTATFCKEVSNGLMMTNVTGALSVCFWVISL